MILSLLIVHGRDGIREQSPLAPDLSFSLLLKKKVGEALRHSK